jgi:hypothetical protein
MRIGEFATELGLNPKTIRYHERIGLLPQATRTYMAACWHSMIRQTTAGSPR